MGIIGRIIGGLLLGGFGFLFVWKSEWLLQNFGTVAWAEANLSGGSRLFYKLIGIGIITIGFLLMTGLLGGLLFATVGRLFVPPGTTLPA